MGKLGKHFFDLKVKTKLGILILIFLLSHVLISMLASTLFRSLETLNIVVNEQRVFLENFHRAIENFYEYKISGDKEQLKQSKEDFEKAYQIAFTFSHIDSLMNTMSKEEWLADFYEVFKEGVVNQEQIELMANQIQLLSRFNEESLADVRGTATDAYLLTSEIVVLIDSYTNNSSDLNLLAIQKELAKIDPITETFSAQMYELNDRVTKMLIMVMSILVLLLIAFATFVSILISRSIASPIARLADNFKKIAKGNLKSSVKIDSKNEIGDLSRAFLEIQTGLQNIVAHSKNVARGEYQNKLVPKSENDELTISLNQMTNRLQESKEMAEKELWLQNGISGLDDEMRGNYLVRELSGIIINYVCNFLNVEMGALYVYDEVLEHLELTGYAGINPEQTKQKLKPGEGLVGKAAKNDKIQVLDTSDKYHKIFSATGEIIPRKLYLIPLFYSDQIQAVIELAPMHELTEKQMEFLELTMERISVNLNASVVRYRSDELLKKTLDQAKKLEERDNELSQKLIENRRIQEDLVKEKALLDSMLKIIPDSIHFKDLDNKFLRVSDSLLKLFDVDSADEIIGKTDFDFYEKREAQQYFEEEKRVVEEQKGYVDNINKNVDDSGNVSWTSVTKLPMYDENGKCIGTFSISKDITDIKKLEIEVQKQNDNLISNQHKLKTTIERMDKVQSELEYEKSLMDSLLNTLPDAVYFKDTESRFIKVSQSMPKLFGKEKPEELYGKSDFDFFHDKKHAKRAYKDEQDIIKTRKPIVGLVEKETYKDGTVRYVSTTKMPLLNKKGNVMGTFGISRDITEVKKLELEVKERNEKLKAQQEEMKVTNEELKTQEEELRVANEELAEQTKVLSENEKNLQTQQEELRVTNEELETKTDLLEQQKKEILEKNENLLKIQNELKQKAKELEQASQYKSEFLANMSHELRTPLNSLLILSKLLGSNKKGNLTDEQVQSVNIIYKSGKDLLELINEILDLSKIEAGKMKYDFEEVPTNDFISEIKQTFEPVAENKGLRLDLNKAEKFPKKIYTDKQRMMQIIKNLLSNAFKFTSEGGVKVKFGLPDKETLFINEKLNKDNSYYVSVEDSGVGIPRNKLEGIFEAFQQADGSISRKFGGTGLGLSISKQLTHVLGGEIHVDSKEGEGSVFTIYLPLDKKLVGDGNQNPTEKKTVKQDTEAPKPVKSNIEEAAEPNRNETKKLPLFIPDDRDKDIHQLLVLIIHGDKEKAKNLLELSHKRKFSVIAASGISDGIQLAEHYNPKAIIISAELSDSKEIQQLKTNKITGKLPLHVVSRIEDSVLKNIEGLKTAETENFEEETKNIESKISKEYKEVLVVEDDEITRKSIQMLFENKDIIIHEAQTAQEAYDLISTKPFDSVILDLGLPDYSGKDLLKKLKKDKVPIPNVIINTARELSPEELRELQKYSDSIVIKGVKSDERLMDEVTLFLHQVEHTQPKTAPIQADEEEIFKGKKVLVVDDDIRNIFALAQILEEREIEVLEAENGEVAIEVLKNDPGIDLVLMDIMMPVMNGYKAMEVIRKTPGIEDIPIITLTAKAMKEDYQKAIDSGANDYISKPVDMDKLMSLLKIWLFK